MFAGTALSVRLFVCAGLSLFIICGPYLSMVVCVFYAYNLTEGPSDSHTYVEFIHQALNSFDTNGLPVLYPGCCIVSNRAPIHGKHAMDILYPYLEQNGIDYFYLPTYSPCLNPVENCFLYLKSLMKSSDFQELLRFYVPTAIYNAIPYLTHDMILNFFKNVSCNYMKL